MSKKRIDVVKVQMVKEDTLWYLKRRIEEPKDAADIMRDFIGNADREWKLSKSSSLRIAFILVYKPSCKPKPYFFKAIRFHLAKEWTTSIVSPGISFIVKDTGFSYPFKLSLIPELFSTYIGAETRFKPISLPNSSWNVSRI